MPYAVSGSKGGKNEACLCGEELRGNAPVFSSKVYENILSILGERLSQKAYRLFYFCNEYPLAFRFTRAQRDKLNLTFYSLAQDAYLEDRDAPQTRYKS